MSLSFNSSPSRISIPNPFSDIDNIEAKAPTPQQPTKKLSLFGDDDDPVMLFNDPVEVQAPTPASTTNNRFFLFGDDDDPVMLFSNPIEVQAPTPASTTNNPLFLFEDVSLSFNSSEKEVVPFEEQVEVKKETSKITAPPLFNDDDCFNSFMGFK